MSKVSVIVPNYNHAPFLEQRIESILDQTFQDYELILLDDFSKDASRDIIHHYKKKYPDIRVFLNNRNSGSPFKQWDFGMKQAEGEYVWIAESDDYADRNFLSEMVPILDKNDNAGLAYCDSLIVDERDKPIALMSDSCSSYDQRRKNDYVNNGRDEIENYLCIGNSINNASSVLFKKTSYIKAGLADHAMRYCGDWFLYLRMLLISDIAYRAKKLNFIRLHADSSFHEYYANSIYIEELIRIYNFVMQNVPIISNQKKRIYDQLSIHYLTALKKGVIPSRQVFFNLKKIVPFFELNTLRCLASHMMKKYCRRFT
jgi:glycosyltransferase involved in cell wall biosynthesis